MLEKLTLLDALRAFGWGLLGAAPIFFTFVAMRAAAEHPVTKPNPDPEGSRLVGSFSLLMMICTQVAFGVMAYMAGGK